MPKKARKFQKQNTSVFMKTHGLGLPGDELLIANIDNCIQILPLSDIHCLQSDGKEISLLSYDDRTYETFFSRLIRCEQQNSHRVVEIEIECGYALRVAENQHVLVVDEHNHLTSIAASMLDQRDEVVIATSFPRNDKTIYYECEKQQRPISREVAKFIGMCIGGCAEWNDNELTIFCATRIRPQINNILRSIKAPIVIEDISSKKICIKGKHPIDIIKSVGISTDSIPTMMYNVHKNIQAAFLEGYFTTAGCTIKYPDGHCGYACVGPSNIIIGITAILYQMAICPDLYRSNHYYLIEVTYNDIKRMKGKRENKKTCKKIKVRSKQSGNTVPMYNIILDSNNIVTAHGGFVLGRAEKE